MIITEGGLAGLATGCYRQMNEYTTKIFEIQGQTRWRLCFLEV